MNCAEHKKEKSLKKTARQEKVFTDKEGDSFYRNYKSIEDPDEKNEYLDRELKKARKESHEQLKRERELEVSSPLITPKSLPLVTQPKTLTLIDFHTFYSKELKTMTEIDSLEKEISKLEVYLKQAKKQYAVNQLLSKQSSQELLDIYDKSKKITMRQGDDF